MVMAITKAIQLIKKLKDLMDISNPFLYAKKHNGY
jgi:hypothetical protein